MHFVHLGSDEGLSQGSINAMLQDDQGFFWIGTEAGLDRYDGYSFKHISQEPTPHGSLPRNFVTSMAKDHSGTLWVGTKSGLATRDGKTGRVTSDIRVGGIRVTDPHESIQTIYVDREDRVWVGTTDAGLIMIDRAHNVVQRLRHDSRDESSLSDDFVSALMEDDHGRIWIGTEHGLNRLDPTSGKLVRRPMRTTADIPVALEDAPVSALIEDEQSVLWVATNAGLIRLDPRKTTAMVYRASQKDSNSLPSDTVTSLLEDDAQRIWIGTDSGLVLWNRLTNNFQTFKHDEADPASLPANNIHSLYQDQGGVLWVGTESDGAAHWNPRSWSFGHHQIRIADGRGIANIGTVVEDSKGRLWLGTFDSGLQLLDVATGVVTSFHHRAGDAHSLAAEHVNSVLIDRDGTLWVATRGGLSHLDPTTGKVENFNPAADRLDPDEPVAILEIKKTRAGIIWGATDKGVFRFDPKTKKSKSFRHDPSDASSLSSDHATTIAIDPNDHIWVGLDDGTLILIDPLTEHFYDVTAPIELKKRVGQMDIGSLHIDDHGRLWVGTLGSGLVEVIGSAADPSHIQLRTYTQKDGLDNTTIYAIQSDSSGRIWLSTNRGLSRFDPETHQFKNFHHSHGLQGEEFNQGAAARLHDGQMIFAGPNGYNAFYPDRLEFNQHEPKVALTGYYKLNAPVETELATEYLKKADLGYSDNVVSFEFAALDYSSPESNHFSYMLEGFDKDWIDAGNKRTVTYTNLSAGHYVFKVRAANGDGKWNRGGIQLPISVAAPPWATLPAKIGYVTAALLALLGLRQMQNARRRLELEYARRLEKEVGERTAELERANHQLKEASVTDPLTGLGNRRQLGEAMAALQSNVNHELRMCLMIIDMDHLKPINDAYGHEAGDRVIVQIADILRRSCRSSDYIVRWGGDEFVVAFLDTDIDAATGLAEQIRARIAKQVFRLTDGKTARSSCSIGFCCLPFIPTNKQLMTWEQTLAIADAALNQAKVNRNHWVGISSTETSAALGNSLMDIISLDPAELELRGHITLHRPAFKPEDTGMHLRIVGRRNTD